MTQRKILILGAGVSGLSTGVFLLKAGYRVQIWAKEFTPNTTSDRAAAFWYPFLCNPRDRALKWSAYTIRYLENQIVPNGFSGCVSRSFHEYFDEPVSEPWWRSAALSYRALTVTELPAGYGGGHRCETVVMDTTVYLGWLMSQFERMGGRFHQGYVRDIDEILSPDHVAVNCTGLGSLDLLGDTELFPIRGQIAKVHLSGLTNVVSDDESHNRVLYIVPRGKDMVLGGTAQVGDWNTDIDPRDTEEILRKVALVSPGLESAQIIDQQVGLRPGRSAVRLESEKVHGCDIIHNYGHGGAGYTLSWGCAAEVAQIIADLHVDGRARSSL